MPRNLIESELFGYEGGAFTGAERKGRPGLIELGKSTLYKKLKEYHLEY